MKHLTAIVLAALVLTSGVSAFLGYRSLQASQDLEKRWDAEIARPESATRFTLAEVALSRGQADVAATLYRGALEEDLPRDDRLAAHLGLAQANARLGLNREARSSLQAAIESAGRPDSPRELLSLADRAYQSGAWRATRQILAAVLLLEDDPRADKTIIARARLRIGDTFRHESEGESIAASSSSWTSWLEAIDPDAVPEVRVHASATGEFTVDLEARRVEIRRVLRVLLRRIQPGTPLPIDLQDASLAVTAELRLRPAGEVLQHLALLAGLDYEVRAGRHWFGPLPSPQSKTYSSWARERAREAFQVALTQDGVAAPKVHLQIGQVDLADGRTEAGIDRLRALVERWPAAKECRPALLALATAEAQQLRFARSREALFRLLDRQDTTDLAPQAFLGLARSFFAEGRDEDGERAAAHLLRAFPDAPQIAPARVLLGQLALEQLRYDDAILVLSPLSESETIALRREALILMGRAQLGAKRPGEAAILLRPLIPTSTVAGRGGAEVLLLYAKSEEANSQALPALLAYRSLTEYHAESEEAAIATRAITRLRHRLGLLPDAEPETPQEVEDAARAWLGAGEPGRARALLIGVEKPTLAQQVLLASAELALGRAEAALSLIRALPPLEEEALQTRAARLLAQALRALGRNAELHSLSSRRLVPQEEAK